MHAVTASGTSWIVPMRTPRWILRGCRVELRHPEEIVEPDFLRFSVVTTSCHGSRVTARPGEVLLPPPRHAGDDRLGQLEATLLDPVKCLLLVISPRFHVHDDRLGAGSFSAQ